MSTTSDVFIPFLEHLEINLFAALATDIHLFIVRIQFAEFFFLLLSHFSSLKQFNRCFCYCR